MMPLPAKGKALANEAYANMLFWKQGMTRLLKRRKMVNGKGQKIVEHIKREYPI
jgi:hypothetical protein